MKSSQISLIVYLTKTFPLCVFNDKGEFFFQIVQVGLNQFGGYLQKFQTNLQKNKRKSF
jgi:hypothetical protein